MVSAPLLNEDDFDLLVAYSSECDEERSEAIVNAFLAANVDVYEHSTTLVDWVDPDVVENLCWSSDRPFYLCTRIWDHDVVLTPDEVRIYTSSRLDGRSNGPAVR